MYRFHKGMLRCILSGCVRLGSRKGSARAAEALLRAGEVPHSCTREAVMRLCNAQTRSLALTAFARKRARASHPEATASITLALAAQACAFSLESAQSAVREPPLAKYERAVPHAPLLAHALWARSLRKPRYIAAGKSRCGKRYFCQPDGSKRERMELSASRSEAEHFWSLTRALRNLQNRAKDPHSMRLLRHAKQEMDLCLQGAKSSTTADPFIACARAQLLLAQSQSAVAEDVVNACASSARSPPDPRSAALQLAFRRARRFDKQAIVNAALQMLHIEPASTVALRALLPALVLRHDSNCRLGVDDVAEPVCNHLDVHCESEAGWLVLFNLLMKTYGQYCNREGPREPLRAAVRARVRYWRNLHFAAPGVEQAKTDVRNRWSDEERYNMVLARALCARAILGVENCTMVQQYQQAFSKLEPNALTSAMLNGDVLYKPSNKGVLTWESAVRDLSGADGLSKFMHANDGPEVVDHSRTPAASRHESENEDTGSADDQEQEHKVYVEESMADRKFMPNTKWGSGKKRKRRVPEASDGELHVWKQVPEEVLQRFTQALNDEAIEALYFQSRDAARLAVICIAEDGILSVTSSGSTSRNDNGAKELARATFQLTHATVQSPDIIEMLSVKQLAAYVQELVPERSIERLVMFMGEAAVYAAKFTVPAFLRSTDETCSSMRAGWEWSMRARRAEIEMRQTSESNHSGIALMGLPVAFWRSFPMIRRLEHDGKASQIRRGGG